jgi:hypothetical protein
MTSNTTISSRAVLPFSSHKALRRSASEGSEPAKPLGKFRAHAPVIGMRKRLPLVVHEGQEDLDQVM